jgi:cellulose biosynthesis protein BcsQ
MENQEMQLSGKSLTLAQPKGGVGKTTLIGNLASIADLHGLRVVVVDCDSGAPMTRLVLDKFQVEPTDARLGTLYEALYRTGRAEQVGDLLQPAPLLGDTVHMLPGYFKSFLEDDEGRRAIEFFPQLIQELKNSYVDGHPVDLVLLDAPGEDVVTQKILNGVDAVAFPFELTTTTISRTRSFFQLIYEQMDVNENLFFLGGIPYAVQNKSTAEREIVISDGSIVQFLNRSQLLLPYIPHSDDLRKTFGARSADGRGTAPFYARNSVAVQRLEKLWLALMNDENDSSTNTRELLERVGATPEQIGLDGS